jgi:uncharacterized phage protein gp47/JayE
MAGLSSTGLALKTLTEILSEINDNQKASPLLGANWDTSTTSPQGVMNGIVAAALSEGWQVLGALHTQSYPDGAQGVQLDRVAEYTGALRLAASKSKVKVACAGANSTSLAAGRVLSVGGGARFASTEDATITTAPAWASSTAYALYALVQNDGGKLYVCTQAGTSAGSGGPTGTGSATINDNSAKWRYVATETAGVVVDFESEETGPINANASTLTQIETSVGGWSAALNPFDADLGRNRETDAEFRARRYASLRIQGKAAVDAIRADVLDVADVTACVVFNNVTMTTDIDGVPPKAVEVLVQGGENQAIFDALLSTVPVGTETHGTVSGTALDATGKSHPIKFTRPTDRDIYVTVDVSVVATEWPSNGADQIKTALVAFGDALEIGDDVVRSQLFAPVRTVSGVYDVTDIKLGFSAAPAGTSNLTIAAREKAVFDTSRIVVNVTVL